MKVEISNKRENPLFNRLEVECVVEGDGATPSRSDLRSLLAKELGSQEDLVVIDRIRQPSGERRVYVSARVYQDAESVKVEAPYKIERMNKGKKEGDKDGGEEKA